MRLSKNRQSGFIKSYSSSTNLRDNIVINECRNEQQQKFNEQFSSFHYKSPNDESQNQFSLFVYKRKDKSPEQIKGQRNYEYLHIDKQKDFREIKNLQYLKQYQPYYQSRSYKDDSNNQSQRNTHGIEQPNYYYQKQTIMKNYYSTSKTQPNKFTADNKKQTNYNNLSGLNNRLLKKQVGKLTSKHIQIQRQEESNNYKTQKYQKSIEQLQKDYKRQLLNKLKRVTSQKTIKNYQVQQQQQPYQKYYKKDFHNKPHNKQHNLPQQNYENSKPRQQIKLNQNKNHKIIKQVSQSSVIYSQPSFLKNRLQQVDKRKRQLEEKKRQLEQLKKKSRQILQINQLNYLQQNYQRNFILEKQEHRQNNHLEKQNQSQSSSSEEDESISQANITSENSQPQESQASSSSSYKRQKIYQHQQTQYRQIPPKYIQNKEKSKKKNQQPQKFQIKNTFALSLSPKNINQLKQKEMKQSQKKQINPLKIIQEIQKRNQTLKAEELKEQYKSQGISVSKGGITFDIDPKNFIYPQEELNSSQNNKQQLENKNNLKKTNAQMQLQKEKQKKKTKINSKEQIKRRRQLAKSYDRYARNRIFG